MEQTFFIALGASLRERVVRVLGVELARALPDTSLRKGLLEGLVHTLAERTRSVDQLRAVPITLRTGDGIVELEVAIGPTRDTWMCSV